MEKNKRKKIIDSFFPMVISLLISEYDYYFMGKITKIFDTKILKKRVVQLEDNDLERILPLSETQIVNTFKNSSILRIYDIKNNISNVYDTKEIKLESIYNYSLKTAHIIFNFIILNDKRILTINYGCILIFDPISNQFHHLININLDKHTLSLTILTDNKVLIKDDNNLFILDPDTGHKTNINLAFDEEEQEFIDDYEFKSDIKICALNNGNFAVTSSDEYLRIYDRKTNTVQRIKRICDREYFLSPPFELHNGTIIYCEQYGNLNWFDPIENKFIDSFYTDTYWHKNTPIQISDIFFYMK